jgi:hypothetical protein
MFSLVMLNVVMFKCCGTLKWCTRTFKYWTYLKKHGSLILMGKAMAMAYPSGAPYSTPKWESTWLVQKY